MFELVFLSGARAGVVVPVGGTMLAGRDAGCALEVPDPRVSRSHARFEWDGVRFGVTDTDSSNGTFVNEQPVARTALEHGDVVRLGSTRLRVRRRDQRNPAGARTALFGFRDAGEQAPAHTVSMARLVESSRRGDPAVLRHRLASLMRIADVSARKHSVDDLCAPAFEILFDLLPQTDRAFLLLGGAVDALEPRAVRQRGGAAGGEPKVSRSICRAALERRAALLYREDDAQPIEAGQSVIDLRIHSAIAVPLIAAEQVLGLIVLDTRDPERAYGRDDLELAAAFGQQVAVALRTAQLLREVEAQTAMRNNLMRFLPEAMANQVLAGEIDAGLSGRRCRGSILFSDVIGFASRAERMGPDELVAFMNRYFQRLVPCVEHEGGSIDKFMGDAIMAVWGIPADEGHSALCAAAAALAMQHGLAAFNSELGEPLPMGIGVNSGEVVAGNIGAPSRREYTVLGDAVNTAQRLGAAACREQVLVSEATWKELEGRGFGVCMPALAVKNRAEPVPCYSVRGLTREHDEVQLFVPVRCNGARAFLVRRLADGSFLALHSGDLGALTVDAIELPAATLGVPEVVASLAPEAADGALRRSVVRLPEPTLGGLLSAAPQACGRTWAQMNRADTNG